MLSLLRNENNIDTLTTADLNLIIQIFTMPGLRHYQSVIILLEQLWSKPIRELGLTQ